MKTIQRMFVVAAIVTLSLTAHTAPGGNGGGKNKPKGTLTFDDLAGDAIQSDGLGPYEASATEEEYGAFAEIVVSLTNRQEIWLDFSDCDPIAGLSCDGPFGPAATSDYVAGVTIDFRIRAPEPGVTDRVNVSFGFQTSEGKWSLATVAEVTPYDDDNDGAIDRYGIDHDGTTSSKLFEGLRVRRGQGPFPDLPDGFAYVERGRFFMPWGATLELP
jgi:hypothetical protein